MLLDIHYYFPRLALVCSSPHTFKGYISIASQDYYVKLKVPFFPSTEDLQLSGDVKFLQILNSCQINYKQIHKDETLLDFLRKLACLNGSLKEVSNNRPSEWFDQHAFLSTLLSHIEVLGWENVSHISPDFSEVSLRMSDQKARIHKVHIKFSSSNPSHSPIIDVDLPIEANFKYKADGMLLDVYQIWRDYINKLQPFWDVMDDIDTTAFVLDPPNPGRKHSTRRILLENKVSVQLSISPEHPLSRPKCQFLGPTSLVIPLDEKILENYEFWNAERGIIQGLEELIEIKVIRKQDSQELPNSYGALEFECAVCYSLHLDEQLPDHICEHCQKKFHLECLYDWLRSLPNSNLSVNFIRGECPFCTKDISCEAPR